MYYFLFFLNIFLFASVWRLVQRMDRLERACTEAVRELERKISLVELERKEAELSALNKEWRKIQDDLCDAEDTEDEIKIKNFEEKSDVLDKAIETLEEEIKHLRWARFY